MKPMLAAKPDPKLKLKDLRFPLLGSPKLDGIRALVSAGSDMLLSRRLTPIANQQLQFRLSRRGFSGMDGELFLPLHLGDFHRGSGYVRSRDEPNANLVQFHVFDDFTNPKVPFYRRLEGLVPRLREKFKTVSNLGLLMPEVVNHELIEDLDDLEEFEERMLDLKYEGVMLRHPEGPYKYGRSTMREHWLIKIKRFSDAEFKVIGFKEQMKNNNAATTDELGKSKRSKHQENMVGKDTLGSFECVGINGRFKGVEFDIAGGSKQEGAIDFDDAFRKEVWKNKKKYLNRVGTYTYFEPGSKDAPRHAGLFRWRDDL